MHLPFASCPAWFRVGTRQHTQHRNPKQWKWQQHKLLSQSNHKRLLNSAILGNSNANANAKAKAKCQMPRAKCQIPKPNATCQMPNAKCQMPNAKCPMPNAKCQCQMPIPKSGWRMGTDPNLHLHPSWLLGSSQGGLKPEFLVERISSNYRYIAVLSMCYRQRFAQN